jgi:hypothetical protein
LPYQVHLSTLISTLIYFFVHCVELLLITIYVLFGRASYDFRRDEMLSVGVGY